ncbi:MAG: OsmC family protein [bacterium]
MNNYEFKTTFDWQQVEPLLVDEPEPLGGGKGPNASRLLGAAVGNCLSASLLFCLEKAKVEIKNLKTEVKCTLQRNEKGRLRIAKLDVTITVDVASETPHRIDRCLGLFEDYCVVTASVRKGIEVNVRVVDPQGNRLYEA